MQITPRSSDPIRPLTLDAPISVVTLLEDRAQIKRIGNADLEPGLWRLQVERVAPVLSDKSLRAEFQRDYPGARIDDVRARRQMLVKEADRPADIQALQSEARSLLRAFEQAGEDRSQREFCFDRLQDILERSLQELPMDAAWGQVDPRSWREQLQPLFQRLRELRSEVQTTYQTQKVLRVQLQDLLTRLKALYRPDLVYVAAIEADVMIAQAGNYGIAFDYVVPNALWRPYHQARLLPGGSRGDRLEEILSPLPPAPSPESWWLSFQVDGCVWQRTGEDWQDVELIFSTARASLGTEPPLLADDLLNVQEKAKQVVIQARDQQVQTTGMGAGEIPDTVELPGVDDGGEVRNLRSATRTTIPADGQPYRVPLFSFETPAEVEFVLMPELSCQVIFKSVQVNTAQFPLLAGPVDLVRHSGFVGRTSLLFIAPGEKFALGWGPEESLRVQRTQEEKKDQDLLTRWRSVTTTVNLFLSNIGAEPRRIKTTERVPLSELEQVKVEVMAAETTHGVKPDENGFCTWTFNLEPYSQQQATLVYKLSSAPDVQGL
ncbi:hypothetical protein BST81_16185 [Leptolyngbya sp. 'hensonii']|uniref:mucoidy inhibitor MuiA family protein n=1 Tax=Leptolyngbya sp. 'hensonii' TaxID=1922337 RepID=UPI00094FD3A8|nr:mucoidy inhibitor MuiA family protein [Leptolyngbya sp. 'hensonii']OLP17341.1 hypothetical protein BST81_16185 [Leptolyngbya sp. 'hensonii']